MEASSAWPLCMGVGHSLLGIPQAFRGQLGLWRVSDPFPKPWSMDGLLRVMQSPLLPPPDLNITSNPVRKIPDLAFPDGCVQGTERSGPGKRPPPCPFPCAEWRWVGVILSGLRQRGNGGALKFASRSKVEEAGAPPWGEGRMKARHPFPAPHPCTPPRCRGGELSV